MGRLSLHCMRSLCVLMLVCVSHSFNVNTKFPTIYGDDQNGSYFGYTVVLHTSGVEHLESWIHVGAPRGQFGNKASGNVYQCLFEKPCQLLQIASAKKQYKANDGDWVGAAMDIKQMDSCNRLLVCGHRWYENTKENVNPLYGACYWRDTDTTNRKSYKEHWMWPIYNTNMRTEDYGNRIVVYNWYLGQSGISTHLTLPDPRHVSSPDGGWQNSQAKTDLLIGAPGILNWGGGVTVCQSKVCLSDDNLKCSTPTMSKFTNWNDYTGYQVSSGRFFKRDKLVYVASAPRAEMCIGKVILIELKSPEEWRPITAEVGAGVGEYFGASLAVGDFNNDKLDDLIVGSPLRFTDQDEGCINLYYGNSKAAILRKGSVKSICGIAHGARFGSALMALGDLDKDGFDDLAVGAPYENENRGAVYIYNGGREGISSAYSQRITAEEVDGNLRGFGISIARPVDIDNNKYDDLAVGSYLSGHVVILRSHPVVKLNMTLTTSIQNIREDTTNFNITACLRYDGLDVPQEITVGRTIQLFDEYRRVSFTTSNSSIHTTNITITTPRSKSCDDLEVTLQHHKQVTILGAIEIRMSASLVHEDVPREEIEINKKRGSYSSNGFCKTCSMLSKDQTSTSETIYRLEFAVDCGVDNVCESELNLDVKFIGTSSNEYVIGSAIKLDLQINVSNAGEAAYGVQLNIIIPLPVQVAQFPPNCVFKDGEKFIKVTCDLVRPLKHDEKDSLKISLDLTGVNDVEALTFTLSATTTSSDKNKDVTRSLELQLRSEANVTIFGQAFARAYDYAKLNSSTIEFTHVYEITKSGTSPIERVAISISLPTGLKSASGEEVNFLQIYKPTGDQDKQPLTCETEIDQNSFLKETVSDESQVREKRSVDGTEDNTEGKISVNNLPTNRTFFINCSMTSVICKRISCTSRQFREENSFATITITMRLNVTVLEQYLDKRDIIFLATEGSAKIEQTSNSSALPIERTTIATIFIGRVATEEVSNWLIAVSVGCGLLLFFFVVMGLIKAGFFQRKKKQELEALITADNEERAFVEARMSVLQALSDEE